MHLKFTLHGTGDPEDSTGYVLGAKDANGNIRADVGQVRACTAATADSVRTVTEVPTTHSGGAGRGSSTSRTGELASRRQCDCQALRLQGIVLTL